MLARAGCDRPTSTTLLCHSERKRRIFFPCEPKTACGLFRARRRKTNEVQSNICIVSIQILRRSAPQNDKTGRTARRTTRWDQTIHCSQTPRQTGICNWRQREGDRGKNARAAAVCRNTIRRSAVRAEAPPCGGSQTLAPRASARKQLPAPTTKQHMRT